ncbi:2-dehydro-3-deoxy-6-phosphogalactonate aldolase [Caulobacter sp. RHG1]|uniref:2-dehydro-3-deoxy-6-phosphogalactonate aldolase n=1 Tax=Caulobacter sp. (strain RHG1) TaxID=2545762 RepID=UPI001555CEA7|nr:2-dehydro-3-deoxy-6-phosphogalactonate aldolase [Caulobacter sp. RHG1]NQE61860.1 2-dehydro-3-deoxyphosphogalactonate aldolase [Caulobacter sp. RHG1]
MTTWTSVLETLPLVAILRGLKPDEAVEVGEALVAAGFRCLEVPLNSPQPLDSIRRLRDALGDRAIVGAGTVLSPRAVQEVADAGGQIIISPNSNPDVIAATKAAGLISFPAFFTPTEAFAAIDAGADALKLFPAETAGPATLKAIKAVLPPAVPVFPVGGVDPRNLAAWRAAGANGFGLGSALYKPGQTAAQVGVAAEAFVAAWKAST